MQTNFTITSEADLNSALQQIDVGGTSSASNTTYTFTFTADLTGANALSTDLYGINLASGSTLNIVGSGHALDGANTYRGFFVLAGQVNIQDLTIQNTTATGGAGGAGLSAGGGGLGAGGGLFVNTGASVTLTNVDFTDDAAAGGVGGQGADIGGGGGGGGLGGAGGSSAVAFSGETFGGDTGGAGGGGLGLAATGGAAGSAGGGAGGAGSAGIALGAGAGGYGSIRTVNDNNPPGGNFGGGGGGGFGGEFTYGNGSGGGGGGINGSPGTQAGGGNGGDFGGGGGGGGAHLTAGGNGGFGGGGGGNGIIAAAGGFGGGGAGQLNDSPGAGGFGGGEGGLGGGGTGVTYPAGGGGGGASFGGAVFVRNGGQLTIDDGAFSGDTVAGGAGGVSYISASAETFGATGLAAGTALFLQGSGTITYEADTSETISETIVDEEGFVVTTGYTPPKGYVPGSYTIDKTGNGTLTLSGDNAYSGGTTIEQGALDLTALNAAGIGEINFAGDPATNPTTLQIESTALDSNNKFDNTIGTFRVGQTIDLRGIGAATSAPVNPATDVVTVDGGTTAVTLQLDSNLTYGGFKAISDGNGGTDLVLVPTITAMVGMPVILADVELKGTAQAGDSLTFFDENNDIIGTGTVGQNGSFDVTMTTALAEGVHTVTATETDPSSGLTSQASDPFTVDVFPQAPTITTLVGQPLTGQTVELQGTGEAGDTVALYADGNTNTVVGSGVVGAGGNFNITSTATFGTGTHTFTAAETDAADLTSAQSTPTFQVSVLHQAPAITAGGVATFGGAPVVLDAGVTVSDIDSGGTLAGATVAISSGLIAGDTLNFTDTAAITGSYDAATGTLTLSGTDTLADYQAALDSISYSFNPAGSNATEGGTDTSRTISWQVNDGSASNGPSNIATSAFLLPLTPLVTAVAANVNAGASETFTPAQLFTASDAEAAPILSYQVEDESTGPNQGFWVLNNAVLPSGQLTTLSAAQLSQLSFVAGSASTPVADTLEVAATDAAGSGPFTTFTVTASAHASTPAPTVTAANELVDPGLTLVGSSLFSATAFGGNTITSYEIEDATPYSGYWLLNGVIESTNQLIDLTEAQLSELNFTTGYGGDTLMVRANDGNQWSSLSTFTVAPPPNAAAPSGTTADMIMRVGVNGASEIFDIGHNAILLDGPLGAINPALQVAGLGGFDGSDTSDLLMRDPTTGAFTLYDVANNNVTGHVSLGQVGTDWQVASFGDFSGHAGETDMLMRNSNTGVFEVYDISNNAITFATSMGQVGLQWQVAGFGDFSGHAGETGDMLLRNSNTGAFEVYDISNNAITFAASMGAVGTDWQVAGFGDFSGNANETDMLLRDVNTGQFEVYDISNNTITAATGMGAVGLEWQVAGFGDFSGNANETDMLMRNSTTGAFEVYDISHNAITAAAPMGQVGTAWQVGGIAPASAMSQLTQAMAAFGATGGALDTSSPLGPANSTPASSNLFAAAGQSHPA